MGMSDEDWSATSPASRSRDEAEIKKPVVILALELEIELNGLSVDFGGRREDLGSKVFLNLEGLRLRMTVFEGSRQSNLALVRLRFRAATPRVAWLI